MKKHKPINNLASLILFIVLSTPYLASSTNLISEESGTNRIVIVPNALEISIGDSGNLFGSPYNFLYHYSLTQTLYFPEEITVPGCIINEIGYTSAFNDEIIGKQIQIWMGETNQQDLTGGWIDPSNLQLVFDGLVDFPEGISDILIELDQPYTYQGGNLVIYSYKQDDSWSSGKNFHNTMDAGSNRTRRAQRLDEPFNPASPDIQGSLTGYFPNIALYITTEGLGSVSGSVINDDNNEPITGAQVKIENSYFNTTTNSDGVFEIQNILPGEYDITAKKFGFYPITAEAVSISDSEPATNNFSLIPIGQHPLSGTVKANDTQLGLAGAEVTLTGYENYQMQTNSEGIFTLEEVFENQSYQLKVTYPGYQPYQSEVFMPGLPLSLEPIELIEIPFPVSNVFAELTEGENAIITWDAPETNDKPNKVLETYKVYRLTENNQDEQELWQQIASGLTLTEYTDTEWPNLNPDVYIYAVVAVYTNDLESPPTLSNALANNMLSSITINLTTDSNESPEAANVILTHQNGNPDHVYTGTVSADGHVFFEEIWKGTYDLEAELEGFLSYYEENIQIWENEVILDIELIRYLAPPVRLDIEMYNMPPGEAGFSWSLLQGQQKEFRYDDGTAVLQVGASAPSGNINVVFGSVHPNDAKISDISWFLTGEGPPVNFVKVWIFGLNANGHPDINNILYQQNNVPNTDLQWNTHILDEAVDAPNGFLIGLSANGYLSLGLDSGNDPDWPFQTNTHYVTGNVSSQSFVSLESLGNNDLLKNYMIRANGEVYNEIQRDRNILFVNEKVKHISLDILSYLDTPINIKKAGNKEKPGKSDFNATGFSVYLDDELIAENTTVTQHNFTELEDGFYTAGVSAIYPTGNSELSTVSFQYISPVEVSILVETNSDDSPEGAEIKLSNSNEPNFSYSTIADESGEYIFPYVRKGEYELSVTLPGFEPHFEEITIEEESDIQVQLVEIITAPSRLTIDNFAMPAGEAVFGWRQGQVKQFRYDNGNAEGGIGAPNGTINTVFGSVHRNSAVLENVSWYLLGDNQTHNAVKIWIFGLTDNGEPNPFHVIYSMENVPNTDDQWNTFELPEPIDVPGGFMIGISYPGQMALGRDSGSDPQWPFHYNTQYYSLNVTNQSFTALEEEGANFQVNLMLRANGVDFGTPEKALLGFNVFYNGEQIADQISNNEFLFTELSEGTHNAGVQSVFSSGLSDISTVNFEITHPVGVTINLATNSNENPEGAIVNLTNQSEQDLAYASEADETGQIVFPYVTRGTYSLKITKDGFLDYSQDDINIMEDTILDITLEEIINSPFGLKVETSETGKAFFSWNNPFEIFSDSFEDGTFNAWGDIVQGPGTPGDGGLAHWHVGSSYAPPAPHGNKVAKVNWGYNINTWLISPELLIEPQTHINFHWISSFFWSVIGNRAQLMVKISTDNGATWNELWNWTKIGIWQGSEWHHTRISLEDYIDQTALVAFHLIGHENATVEIDDLVIGLLPHDKSFQKTSAYQSREEVSETETTAKSAKAQIGYNIFLDQTLIVSEVDEEHFMFEGLAEGTYTAGVQSVYHSGVSQIREVEFIITEGTSNINEIIGKQSIALFPNPARDHVTIQSDKVIETIEITDLTGKTVFRKNNIKEEETTIAISFLESGIYIISVVFSDRVYSHKLKVLK